MRRKKHKATRRIVKYYKLHYGFREPYKVLLDGNFLHAMTQLKYENVEGILKDLLGGAVKLLVSTCAMRELKALAKQDASFQPAFALAKTFMRHKDDCPANTACTECLLKQTGAPHALTCAVPSENSQLAAQRWACCAENGNEQHWWLATQDKDIQQQMRKGGKLGVPLIYASLNGVHLLPPSDQAQAAVTEKVKAQMSLGKHELESEALADLPALQHTGAGTAAKFRRQKARGPNPLAVKKKVTKKTAQAAPVAAASKKIRRPSRHKPTEQQD